MTSDRPFATSSLFHSFIFPYVLTCRWCITYDLYEAERTYSGQCKHHKVHQSNPSPRISSFYHGLCFSFLFYDQHIPWSRDRPASAMADIIHAMHGACTSSDNAHSNGRHSNGRHSTPTRYSHPLLQAGYLSRFCSLVLNFMLQLMTLPLSSI